MTSFGIGKGKGLVLLPPAALDALAAASDTLKLAFVLTLLTCCPPAPLERVKVTSKIGLGSDSRRDLETTKLLRCEERSFAH